MRKRICIMVAFLAIISVLAGCSIPQECPKDGIWYCDGLEIYLNMKDGEGFCLNADGSYAPVFIQIDYGTGFFINYCEKTEYDPNACVTLRTDYEYKDGTLRLEDRGSGQVYEFIEVDEERYPGG